MCSRSAVAATGLFSRQPRTARALVADRTVLAVDRTAPAVDRIVLAADLELQVHEVVDLAVECLGRIIRLYLFGRFSTTSRNFINYYNSISLIFFSLFMEFLASFQLAILLPTTMKIY